MPFLIVRIRLRLKIKIFFCISIRNVSNDFAKSIIITRILTIFYQSSNKVAKNPSKIIMSCVGEKASGIRQHSYEIPEDSKIGKGRKMLINALFAIIKPPCGTVLYTTQRGAILKTAHQRIDSCIICRI